MHVKPVFLLLATFASAVAPVLADTKLTYVDSGLGTTERKTLIQIHGDKVRMEEADSGIYTLYDNAKKALFTVNTKTKQYIETTPDKMRERMAKVIEMQNQYKEAMKQQIAALPEDQRKIAEERMKQAEDAMKMPPPTIKMEKTERKDSVQNLACTISSVKINDKPAREVCIAGTDAMDATDHTMLVTMFEYMDSISVETAKAQGMTPPAEGFAAVHKDGLALRIQAVPEGPRSELAALSKEVLNAADFSVPADYAHFEPTLTPPTATPAQ